MSVFVASASSALAASGTWTITGNMTESRFGHTATLLQNGQVLAAADSFGSYTAELYTPGTGTWSSTGTMNYTHTYGVAALLGNGKVLVAGDFDFFGFNGNYAEYAEAATDSGEKDLLEGRARNREIVLLLYHGFTTAFWSTLT